MRRKKAFCGFIVGTCISAISTLLVLFCGFILVNLSISLGGARELIVFSLISSAFIITTLILNAVSIATTTTAKKLKQRKGLAITTIIFNFLSVVIYIFSIISWRENGIFYTIFYSCLLLGIIIANVLAIVDIVQNDVALKKEAVIDEPAPEKIN